MADLEDLRFRSALQALDTGPSVFVSGLPRAGTTLLLQLLESSGDFASNTYRDMPFLFCPLLWAQLSGRFRQSTEGAERAHGDGVLVDFDSAEAFEEALWRAFWPDHYRGGRIRPWTPVDIAQAPDFADFFARYRRKIVLLRNSDGAPASRYLSKNNGNIARLSLLSRLEPDAQIIIPFREPMAQARSLHRQHLNFLSLQTQDPFALRYMTDIGHFDLGKALKPIDFAGWVGRYPDLNPAELEFWARYWVAAYAALLALPADSGLFWSFERLCERPESQLDTLASRLGLPGGAKRMAAGAVRPTASREDKADIPDDLVREATDLHRCLLERAL